MLVSLFLSKDVDLNAFQEKPHGWKKDAAQPSSLSAQKGETDMALFILL